ncbi:MAG TPA: hypothetical protein VGL39_20100 [Jatrophihabitantaceae bacterium]
MYVLAATVVDDSIDADDLRNAALRRDERSRAFCLGQPLHEQPTLGVDTLTLERRNSTLNSHDVATVLGVRRRGIGRRARRPPDSAWISIIVRRGRLIPINQNTTLQAGADTIVLAGPNLADDLRALFQAPARA